MTLAVILFWVPAHWNQHARITSNAHSLLHQRALVCSRKGIIWKLRLWQRANKWAQEIVARFLVAWLFYSLQVLHLECQESWTKCTSYSNAFVPQEWMNTTKWLPAVRQPDGKVGPPVRVGIQAVAPCNILISEFLRFVPLCALCSLSVPFK